jgi:hypothetical protein
VIDIEDAHSKLEGAAFVKVKFCVLLDFPSVKN